MVLNTAPGLHSSALSAPKFPAAWQEKPCREPGGSGRSPVLKLSAIPSHTLQPPQTLACSARGPQHQPSLPQESSEPLVARVELRELRRVTVLGGSALLPWGIPQLPWERSHLRASPVCLGICFPHPMCRGGGRGVTGCYSEGGDGGGRVRLSGGSSLSVGSWTAPGVWGGLRVPCCIQAAAVLLERLASLYLPAAPF